MPLSRKPVRILGVPMDLGASRRGTDMGPSALRIAGLGDALRGLGWEVERERDLPVPAMETRETSEKQLRFRAEILDVCRDLASAVQACLDEGVLPLVLGGDHSIAMGTVAGLVSHHRARQEKLGLIWFDAHGDMNIPDSSPSGNIHGMPLAHILGHGDPEFAGLAGDVPMILPENVALVGIREIDGDEKEVISASGVHTFTMRDIDERGMGAVAKEILEVVNHDTAGFHLSFDVDGLDPKDASGVGTPVPGGVSFREAHLLLENCADSGRMTSMEVVELNPILDSGNASAETVKHLVLSAFGMSIL
jgi:arginase